MDKRTKEYKEMMARQAAGQNHEPTGTTTGTATAPWKDPSPWKRDTLRVVNRRPGYRVRWVDPRNFERNLEDGWTYAKRENYIGVHDRIPGEEAQMDSKIRRRGMVLMEIPEEKALQRDEFYANLASKAEKSIKERHKKEARENFTESYEPK